MSIFEILKQVAQNIPGCIHTSVVDIDSGMSLAAVSPGHEALGAAGADAYQSDMFRFIQKANNALDAPQATESIVLIGESSVFIATPFHGTAYFWHVVTSIETTIGFTQAIMRKYQQPLEESMAKILH